MFKVSIFCSVIQLGSLRLDPVNDQSEDDFLASFGLPQIKNLKVKARRAEALKEHEKLIKRENEQYKNGVRSFWAKLNDFADLPDDKNWGRG